MASKRQPSKQKRAAQNRSERAAREARAANAQVAARTASSSGATGALSAGSGSLLSRLRGGSTAGAKPTDTSTGSARSRGAALRPAQPPGYRAALSAVLAAVAAVGLCTFALRYPVDAQGDLYTSESLVADWSNTALQATIDQPDATPAEVADSIQEWAPGREKEVVVKALWPYSLAILLPLIGAVLGFQAVRKRSSSKIVNRTLYATLFGAVLTQGLLMLFLPVVIGMGVAMFQVRKAETVAAAGGGVIDVEPVEDPDLSDADD